MLRRETRSIVSSASLQKESSCGAVICLRKADLSGNGLPSVQAMCAADGSHYVLPASDAAREITASPDCLQSSPNPPRSFTAFYTHRAAALAQIESSSLTIKYFIASRKENCVLFCNQVRTYNHSDQNSRPKH